MVNVDAVAEARSALVEQDQAAEPGEPPHQVGVARLVPVDVQIGNEARHEDEIDRPVADHLVGDTDVAALGVSGLRQLHRHAPLASLSSAVTIAGRGGRGRPETPGWPPLDGGF
jgi:hypothetical protein